MSVRSVVYFGLLTFVPLYYVGTLHRGKQIYVMVDPQRGEWVFVDLCGRQLRSVPAEELRAERIRSLTVAKRD